jgi:hypothetical protein
MKKLLIFTVLLLSIYTHKANASSLPSFKDTTIEQKIAILEKRISKQEEEIKKLKAGNTVMDIKGTPVVTRKKFIVSRTGSKQVVAVD